MIWFVVPSATQAAAYRILLGQHEATVKLAALDDAETESSVEQGQYVIHRATMEFTEGLPGNSGPDHLVGCYFALSEPVTERTVGIGLIVAAGSHENILPMSRVRGTHSGLTVWLTGLSGAGKSSLANSVASILKELRMRVQVLDADWLREHLYGDLGFTRKDRDENIRRISVLAGLLTSQDVIVLVAAISPYRAAREEARSRIGKFMEVHVHAPISVCEARDPKGLYRRVRRGEIQHFTGIDDPYEEPLTPALKITTHEEDLASSAARIIGDLFSRLEEPPHLFND